MTNITASLNFDIIDQLFQNSVCLTYDPTNAMSAFQYAMQLKNEYEKLHSVKQSRLCSKNAKLWIDAFTPRFHYFSDGSLICGFYSPDKENPLMKSILRLLKIRNLPVKKIYAPQQKTDIFMYDKFMHYIYEQALIKFPYMDDLYVEEFPSKEKFVQECFTNGNILLTASKEENLHPDCRRYMALFADGKYFIVEGFTKAFGTKNHGKIVQFNDEHRSYIRMHRETVPQEYIDALYIKAQEYDWYISEEEAMIKAQKNISGETAKKMNDYIENLFNGRICLSVVNPSLEAPYLSPDFHCYALFNDGLIVSVNDLTANDFLWRDLQKIYPDMVFHSEKVPYNYIKEIYRRLPKFQKSASIIYIEMLKQKARKLKRMLNIPHLEALDIVAQIAEWKNWKDIKIEDEMHARGLIDAEKWRKKRAISIDAENPLMWEYNYWQKRMVGK